MEKYHGVVMKDRFTNGFVSGFTAGLVPWAINWSLQALDINTVVWVDFMGLFILGRGPQDVAEIIYMLIMQFGFFGVLGVVFALIVPLISSRRLIFKGAVFGLSVWFILFSLPTLFQIGQLEVFPLKTVLVHSVSSILYGVALAFILKWVDNKAF